MGTIIEYREILRQIDGEVLAAIKNELIRLNRRVNITDCDAVSDVWEEHIGEIGLTEEGAIRLYPDSEAEEIPDYQEWDITDFIAGQHITEWGVINILEHLMATV